MSDDYSVEDKSLLIGPLKRLVWGPLLKWLPLGVSANAMTLGGTALNVAALGEPGPAGLPSMLGLLLLIGLVLGAVGVRRMTARMV